MLLECNMDKQTKIIRIRLSSYNKVRRIIKPRVNETIAEYFNRVMDRVIVESEK